MTWMENSIEVVAGQVIMPSLHPHRFLQDEDYAADIHRLVERGIGGFCVFQGTLESTARVLAELQASADVPLLFSADYEHGLAMRLDGGTDFPHAMACRSADDARLTYLVAQAVAREAKALGVHWNFAPVCDINSNPDNPIINIRAFGETALKAIPHISAWIEGSQANGIAACAKHFPGHGDTHVDSHIAVPTLDASLELMVSRELVPFQAALRQGVQSVMVGHLCVPALDARSTIASVSKSVVTDFLRQRLNYQGLIVSDALDMNAITQHYSSAQACIATLSAGVDVALIPAQPMDALNGLVAAMTENAELQTRCREASARVRQLKEWCGLLTTGTHREDSISLEEHGMLALKVATDAIRVVGDENRLPLEQYAHLACFAVLDNDELDPASEFFHYLSQVYDRDTDLAFINPSATSSDVEALLESTRNATGVLFAVFARARAYGGSVALDPRIHHIAQQLRDGRPTIAVLFGNPYIEHTFPADVFVKCFSDSKASRGAACLALSKKGLDL